VVEALFAVASRLQQTEVGAGAGVGVGWKEAMATRARAPHRRQEAWGNIFTVALDNLGRGMLAERRKRAEENQRSMQEALMVQEAEEATGGELRGRRQLVTWDLVVEVVDTSAHV